MSIQMNDQKGGADFIERDLQKRQKCFDRFITLISSNIVDNPERDTIDNYPNIIKNNISKLNLKKNTGSDWKEASSLEEKVKEKVKKILIECISIQEVDNLMKENIYNPRTNQFLILSNTPENISNNLIKSKDEEDQIVLFRSDYWNAWGPHKDLAHFEQLKKSYNISTFEIHYANRNWDYENHRMNLRPEKCIKNNNAIIEYINTKEWKQNKVNDFLLLTTTLDYLRRNEQKITIKLSFKEYCESKIRPSDNSKYMKGIIPNSVEEVFQKYNISYIA